MDLRLQHIRLYDGIGSGWFSAEAVGGYLSKWLPWLDVSVRPDLLWSSLSSSPRQAGKTAPLMEAETSAIAERLCRMRVIDPTREPAERKLLKPEIECERRVMDGRTRALSAVTYDGNHLQRLAHSLLARAERGFDTLHIWITERMIATRDEHDHRYHARAIVCGQPAIISTVGMRHAPARDRSYYLSRRLGFTPAPSEHGDFLAEDDPRTTDVLKGYAMQAVFFALAGDAFCDDPLCRLFNAHWQHEMLAAQLTGDDFCSRHVEVLRAWEASHL